MKTLEELKSMSGQFGLFPDEVEQIALATIEAVRIDLITDDDWISEYEPKGMGYEEVQQEKINIFLKKETCSFVCI